MQLHFLSLCYNALFMPQPFSIIFQDEHIIVVDKLAGLLVVPTPAGEKHTLTALLGGMLGGRVYPCHRLDRQTSGLVVYATSVPLQEKVMAQFKSGLIKKKYLAFIRGRPEHNRFIMEGKVLDRQGARFGESAKYAKTLCRLVQAFKGFSEVELEPLTGRTNQIRIQLAQIGHPILGERIYAFGKDFSIKFRRLALHASRISFTHPVKGTRLEFKLALPQDMSMFLSK
jgi:RluA family pseudouridine synthase